MTEEDTNRPYGLGLSLKAVEKRRKQLEAWRNSDTNLQPGQVAYRRSAKVKFSKGVMLFAAVASGDEKEVERLIQEENTDVNYVDNDGMTALHQCCIDDDLDMLKLLVRHKANINSVDNEGWTPLHAAASFGYDHIVRYLLNVGAFPAAVNNEGQTPSELAEEYPSIVEMIEAEVESQGIDVDEVRCEEERVMLEDAKKMVNNPHMEPIISADGATPLHVAAAKNYTTVLNVLLSIVGQEIDPRDDDGWTPLHAAVYWGSVEAAELLIFNGANIYTKTDSGEGFDDLIDPELEDDFLKLKKLNTEPRRRIRHQVSRQRSLTNMNNQNSMESKGGGTGGITSPGVKRRLSKEKVHASKMIDMKKEKEDLLLSFEKVPEEPTESSSSTRGVGANSSPVPPSQPLSDPSGNNAGGSHNHMTEQPSTTDEYPETQYSRSGSITGSSSPKNARRKGEMSQKMLQRLNLFEIPSSGGSSSGTTPSSGGSTAVSSSSPLPSSPRTSTPISSPMVVQTEDRKRVDSSDIPGPHRTRVGSMDIKTPPAATNTQTTAKRFSFQPKPISSSSKGSASSKSMSLDRGDSSFFKRAFDKMTSLDSTSSKKEKQIEQAKPVGKVGKPVEQVRQQPPTEQVKKPSEQITIPTEPVKKSGSVNQETHSPPIRRNSGSSKVIAASVTTPTGDVSTPAKGDLSTDSNAGLTPKDRSTSFQQPEARRKTTARKQRESRRSTQPVPSDLLQRIKQSDEVEEKELEQSLGGTTDEVESKVPAIQSESSQKSNENSPTVEVKCLEDTKKKEPEVEVKITSPTEKVLNPVETKGPTQSAYRPSNRPASKLISDEECELYNGVVISETLTKDPSSMLLSPDNDVEQTQLQANTTNPSPLVQRSRTNTRRKKVKEKRRSTGIGEPDENEEIPDNLKGIFHRHQGSNDSTDSSSTSGGQTSLMDSSVRGVDESSLSTAAIEYYQQEIDKLRQLLSEEKDKAKRTQLDLNSVREQLDKKDQKIMELQRKCEDTNRAYEQQRIEREQKDKKIQQLEKSDKTISDLQDEIQRLKDENGALIRVVGKLSRAPFSS